MNNTFGQIILDYTQHPSSPVSYVEIVPRTADIKNHKQQKAKGKTKVPPSETPSVAYSAQELETFGVIRVDNWWTLNKPVYGFSDPHIKSMLFKLMGSTVVDLFDVDFMLKLQREVGNSYQNLVKSRINQREVSETARIKKLMLKNSHKESIKHLENHPILEVDRQAKDLIKKRGLQAIRKPRIVQYKTHAEKIRFLSTVQSEASVASAGPPSKPTVSRESVDRLGLLDEEVYKKMKYDNPMMKELNEVQNIEELYQVADKIVHANIQSYGKTQS